MIRSLAVIACTAGVLLAASFAPRAEGHQAPRHMCGIERAVTEQLTYDAKVVRKGFDGGSRIRFWACLRWGFYENRQGQFVRRSYFQRRFLGEVLCDMDAGDSCTYETAVATNRGRTRVAFTQGGCSRYSNSDCPTHVVVVDLKSGQRASTGFRTRSGGPSYFDITAYGTAVWLAVTPEATDGTVSNFIETVGGLTFRGQELLFDEGPDLSEMALAWPYRLYWMRGDEPQTAEVP